MHDLPVAVDLPAPLAEEVIGWVEAAGCQLVDRESPLQPLVVLASAPVPGRPTVVVREGEPSGAEVREALRGGALDVVAWPQDRGRLLDAVASAPAEEVAGSSPVPQRLLVTGAAGGVGTSTVTLAIGALLALSGSRPLVVGDEDLLRLCGLDPWRGPGAAEVAALDPAGATAEVAGLARAVPGLPGLTVLGGGTGALLGEGALAGWPGDVVLLDGRTGAGSADVVVARADIHLPAAADSVAALVLVGGGPLSGRAVRTALGRSPDGWLPTSARVARAGAAGRVPSALPGSYVVALRQALHGGGAVHSRRRRSRGRRAGRT